MTISRPPATQKKWIDALKGIGIVAVVMGHGFAWDSGSILPLIYIFHMPLFFFLSGYLYKPSPDLLAYLRKKTFHLLVPYAAFLLLLVVVPEVYRGLSAHTFGMPEAKSLVKTVIYGGRRLDGVAGAFWFVPCLFLTQQLFNFLVTKVQTRGLLPIVVAATVLSYANSILSPDAWFPLNANVVLAALPIFYIGYVFKRYEETRWFIPVAFVIGICAAFSVRASVHNFYDMKVADYGIPVVTMVSAIAVIIALITVAKQLERVPFIFGSLISLGQASMVIMFVHQTVLVMRGSLGSNNRVYGIVLAIAVSYLVYLLAERFRISRAILLGSESDFKKLISARNVRNTPDPLLP